MLDLLLPWIPSWLISLGAQLIGGAGFVAILYSLLPVAPYRRTAQIAGTAAVCWAIYQYGMADAQAVHETAQLRATIDAKDRSIAERDAQLDDQNEQIRRVQALNARLSDISAQADTDIEELRNAVATAEAARDAARTAQDADCDYTDVELGRVRELIDRARRAGSSAKGRTGR